MKLPITLMSIFLTISAFANGIYLVSGGDFRIPPLKYMVRATEPNQQVEVYPSYLQPLGFWKNPPFDGEWSLKVDGVETTHSGNTGIRSSWGSGSGQLLEDLNMTFPDTNKHLVKMYNNTIGAMYSVSFTNNQSITDIAINLTGATQILDKWNLTQKINSCQNLESITITFPTEATKNEVKLSIGSLPNLKFLKINNPIGLKTIMNGFCSGSTYLESDFDAPYATTIGSSAFYRCINLKSVKIPNIVRVEKNAINMEGKHPLLEELIIGDKIEFVGTGTLVNCEKLKTIGFSTQQQDWISAWNNHPILPKWLGTASAINGSNEEATLTPPEEEVQLQFYNEINPKTGELYYKKSTWPNPTRIIHVTQ